MFDKLSEGGQRAESPLIASSRSLGMCFVLQVPPQLLLFIPFMPSIAAAMSQEELKKRVRSDYGYILEYRTRWSDNDMYDHMNNSIYNFLYDSVVNTYLISQCGLHPPTASQYGLVVHSHSDFFGSIAFPAVAELGLRVNKLGKSSVTYEVALFEKNVEQVKSVGEFVHVFVDRETGRPGGMGMNDSLRRGLEKILVRETSKL